MQYRDFSCYRDGSEDDGEIDVYPSVKNIGWLGVEESYETGSVPPVIIQKLKEILFLDLKNDEDKQNGVYKHDNAINVHCMHIRGSAFQCPFCFEKVVEYAPLGLDLYFGVKTMRAGLNEVCSPSVVEGEFYSFPTMLLHYITEHGYCPPKEFQAALSAFDIKKPYDIDKAQKEMDVVEVDAKGLINFN